jgi:hypothetical protein
VLNNLLVSIVRVIDSSQVAPTLQMRRALRLSREIVKGRMAESAARLRAVR